MRPQQEEREEAMAVLEQMVSLLGHHLEIRCNGEDTSRFALILNTDDPGRIIGRKGHYLRSLELLLNRMLRKKHRKFPWVELDVDGYRKRQTTGTPAETKTSPEPDRQRLEAMASDTAKDVKRWGESRTIGPFQAEQYEVIRAALAADQHVEMHAENGDRGDGGRHVIVRPARSETR